MTCRICDSNKIADRFRAKEMLQGSRIEFEYFICADCSTVQIQSTDLDMREYYNGTYYSLNGSAGRKSNLLSSIRNDFIFTGKHQVVGKLLQKMFPIYKEHEIVASYLKDDMHLLDIGCGNGDFLRMLRASGQKKLTGIEPFLEDTIEIDSDLNLIKGEISSLNSTYDFIRLHHVFEHVPNPKKTLEEIFSILSNEGKVFLTIPIADFIFEKYREHAYLLQAPHHFHLFTFNGISDLVRSFNFKIEKSLRNAKGISNWMYISELWKNNISINESIDKEMEIFLNRKLKYFKETERHLCKMGLGDNLTLVLSKII